MDCGMCADQIVLGKRRCSSCQLKRYRFDFARQDFLNLPTTSTYVRGVGTCDKFSPFVRFFLAMDSRRVCWNTTGRRPYQTWCSLRVRGAPLRKFTLCSLFRQRHDDNTKQTVDHDVPFSRSLPVSDLLEGIHDISSTHIFVIKHKTLCFR